MWQTRMKDVGQKKSQQEQQQNNLSPYWELNPWLSVHRSDALLQRATKTLVAI